MDFDLGDTKVPLDFTDSSVWNTLIRKSSLDQAPALFTSATMKGYSNWGLLKHGHEKDMFLLMAKSVMNTLFLLWEQSTDDHLVCR